VLRSINSVLAMLVGNFVKATQRRPLGKKPSLSHGS
jgi:hypothetical protein